MCRVVHKEYGLYIYLSGSHTASIIRYHTYIHMCTHLLAICVSSLSLAKPRLHDDFNMILPLLPPETTRVSVFASFCVIAYRIPSGGSFFIRSHVITSPFMAICCPI